MAKIFLVRHGLNDMVGKKLVGRLPGIHLNEQGRLQAQQLAEKLRHLPIRAIFSSPLERTHQTAQPIADKHNLSIKFNPGLQELNFGTWEGQEINTLKDLEMWAHVQERPGSFRFPSGESFLEAQMRIVEVLNMIGQTYAKNEIVVCVSHCDMIKLAVAYYLKMPLDAFQRLQISPISVTILDLQNDRASFGPINAGFDFSFDNK